MHVTRSFTQHGSSLQLLLSNDLRKEIKVQMLTLTNENTSDSITDNSIADGDCPAADLEVLQGIATFKRLESRPN